MHEIGTILSTLRDVDGVLGAFVLTYDGQLVDKDLPAMFDASLFREVGPRVVRLRDTFLSGGDELDACAIRFEDHKMHIRTMPKGGFICVLSSISVNMPALKMGIQLAQRRIQTELDTPAEARPPVSAHPLSKTLMSAPPPPMSARSSSSAPLPPPPSATLPPPSLPPLSPASELSFQETPESQPRPVQMYRGRPVT